MGRLINHTLEILLIRLLLPKTSVGTKIILEDFHTPQERERFARLLKDITPQVENIFNINLSPYIPGQDSYTSIFKDYFYKISNYLSKKLK